jgi:hypothetical protein
VSICTESTRGLREPVLQVLVAARVFLGQRVNLQEKYDYPCDDYFGPLGEAVQPLIGVGDLSFALFRKPIKEG